MAEGRSRLVRHASWNLVDQALSAISNIVLSVAVARSVDAPQFGAFSIAFVIFGVLIAVTKSLVGQPLQMRFSAATPSEQHSAAAHGLGAALLIGLAGGVLVAGSALLLEGSLRTALLALALILPVLLVQDSCRMVLLSAARPRGAAAIDAIWAVVMIGLLAVLVGVGAGSVFLLMIAWGAGALFSALVAFVLLRVLPTPQHTVAWIRGHWDLTRYLFPEYFLGLGAMQLAILLVGAIAAAEAVGSLRAAQVLLGPLGILGAGIFQFAVPEVARRQREATARTLVVFASAVSGFLGLVTVVYLVVLLVLPDPWGSALFGDSWPGAAAVLLAMGLSALASSLANGPAGVLYGIQQAKSTFRIHLGKGPVLLVAVLVGTAMGGAVGAAWGLAATEAAVLPAWVLVLRHALRVRHAAAAVPTDRPTEQPADEVTLGQSDVQPVLAPLDVDVSSPSPLVPAKRARS